MRDCYQSGYTHSGCRVISAGCRYDPCYVSTARIWRTEANTGNIRQDNGIASVKTGKWIEVDGGVNADTLESVARTGVDIAVAGTAVFGGDIESNLKKLRGVIADAS